MPVILNPALPYAEPREFSFLVRNQMSSHRLVQWRAMLAYLFSQNAR